MSLKGTTKTSVTLVVTSIIFITTSLPTTVSKTMDSDGNISPLPILAFEPDFFDFGVVDQGDTSSTTFEIWKEGGCCSLTYSFRWFCDWIDVYPTTGTSHGEHDTISVSIDTNDLAFGSHTCDIHIDSNGGEGVFSITVTVGENIPRICIRNISGGLGIISADIVNTGNDDAFDINWSITIQGGIFNMFDITLNGTLAFLRSGQKKQIRTDQAEQSELIHGLGRVDISVKTTYAEPHLSKGFVVLFFVLC
jgi:hypothetical protein